MSWSARSFRGSLWTQGIGNERDRPQLRREPQRDFEAGAMTSLNAPFVAKGLWMNGRDSVMHALDHFSQRGRERSNGPHHDKWIMLSVHHAAECVCNMRLLQLEPKSPLFFRNGDIWFPNLSATLKQLQEPTNSARLSPAEIQLLRLLRQLPNIRHQFMHRTAPEEVDVSIAAMCMIGLLKYIERLKGET